VRSNRRGFCPCCLAVKVNLCQIELEKVDGMIVIILVGIAKASLAHSIPKAVIFCSQYLLSLGSAFLSTV
jgi:hypothetical protein